MTIHYGFEQLPANIRTVVTVGSFDGVHRGHRVLLSAVKSMAERLGAESVVVTFDPHPRIAMGRAEGMGLLTTIEERTYLLEMEGIDRMVVAHFDEEFRQQPFEEFVRCSLVTKLGMVGMIVGYNHRLGRGSEGCYESILPIAQECGFEIEQVAQHLVEGEKISSTVVRGIIERGAIREVEHMLGTKYIICGIAKGGVVEIEDKYKLLPMSGCYDVEVETLDGIHQTTVQIDGRKLTISESISGKVVIKI